MLEILVAMGQETVPCSRCGNEFEQEELTEFDGECLCSDCLDDQTFICDCCNERFWNDEQYGDCDTPLCENCYEEYYTRCERCNRVIRYDAANYEEDDEDRDYPYCDSCYDYNGEGRYLHDYGYKPSPIFHGENKRYFGVELEIDKGGKENGNAKMITELANQSNDNIYIKTDGSLDDGLEIVTHPMTIQYHISEMPWLNILNMSLELGYKSHKTSTCGLHIHVNRDSFGSNAKEQDECVGRILFIVERFWAELLKFSRRTENQIRQWANRYGYKEKPAEILDHAKKGERGRYAAVNITNWNTIEFRLFRGTLKYNTLIATLQLVNEICDVAFSMSDEEVGTLSWCDFVERLDAGKYPELITYLKERRLYVNEAIKSEEDE